MRIKDVPEDFIVEELAHHALDPHGMHVLFLLEKRDMTTEDAIAAIVSGCGLQRRALHYAGTKDARAVTRQYCTADAAAEPRIAAFRHPRIRITVLGRTREPLRLGMLDGNRFEITVRDLGDERCVPCTRFPNYFDEQRFSSQNDLVGRDILAGAFGDATARIAAHDMQHGPAVRDHLATRPNDHVGALRLLPQHTLLMYVHAYQSRLFNAFLDRHIRAHDPAARTIAGSVPITVGDAPDAAIPLPGFDDVAPPWRAPVAELLAADGLTQASFVVRAIPFLTLEGSTRPAFTPLTGFLAGPRMPDDRHPGRACQTFSFTLEKGAYATVAIRCVCRAP